MGCWVFLYFYKCSWHCFGTLLSYLGTVWFFKGCSQGLLVGVRTALGPGLIFPHHWGSTVLSTLPMSCEWWGFSTVAGGHTRLFLFQFEVQGLLPWTGTDQYQLRAGGGPSVNSGYAGLPGVGIPLLHSLCLGPGVPLGVTWSSCSTQLFVSHCQGSLFCAVWCPAFTNCRSMCFFWLCLAF